MNRSTIVFFSPSKKFKTLPPLGINIEGTSDSYDLSYDFENLKEKLFNESINKILKKKKSIILDPKKIKKLIDKNIQKELDAGKIIAQAPVRLMPSDSLDACVQKIRGAEHTLLPMTVANLSFEFKDM